MKVAVPLAKNVLAPLGITADPPAINAWTQKKIHDSGRPLSTTLIISNKKMNDIIKIVRHLKILIFYCKESLKQLKIKQKKKKEDS